LLKHEVPPLKTVIGAGQPRGVTKDDIMQLYAKPLQPQPPSMPVYLFLIVEFGI
jgi:hypothetical protein